MTPNINENPRGRKDTKRGRKPIFDAATLEERINTIERVFGREDKFRRLLLRFDRLSNLHFAFTTLAYTLINLRHLCIGSLDHRRIQLMGAPLPASARSPRTQNKHFCAHVAANWSKNWHYPTQHVIVTFRIGQLS